MQTLFQPKPKESNANDPYMINLKGVKVQVPEKQALEFLKKGFVLVDRKWKPTNTIPQEQQNRDFPLPIEELKKEVAEVVDILEVTEI